MCGLSTLQLSLRAGNKVTDSVKQWKRPLLPQKHCIYSWISLHVFPTENKSSSGFTLDSHSLLIRSSQGGRRGTGMVIITQCVIRQSTPLLPDSGKFHNPYSKAALTQKQRCQHQRDPLALFCTPCSAARTLCWVFLQGFRRAGTVISRNTG